MIRYRACETCQAATSLGKPRCESHVHEMPYVQDIMERARSYEEFVPGSEAQRDVARALMDWTALGHLPGTLQMSRRLVNEYIKQLDVERVVRYDKKGRPRLQLRLAS